MSKIPEVFAIFEQKLANVLSFTVVPLKSKDLKNALEEILTYFSGVVERASKAESRIAELEAAQRWIPVSERLPQIYDDCEGEKSDCCYVRDIHKCVWIAYYRPDEKDWYGLPTGIILTAITHWMPLPQPPEVKE